jgi:hypothetical protein
MKRDYISVRFGGSMVPGSAAAEMHAAIEMRGFSRYSRLLSQAKNPAAPRFI